MDRLVNETYFLILLIFNSKFTKLCVWVEEYSNGKIPLIIFKNVVLPDPLVPLIKTLSNELNVIGLELNSNSNGKESLSLGYWKCKRKSFNL